MRIKDSTIPFPAVREAIPGNAEHVPSIEINSDLLSLDIINVAIAGEINSAIELLKEDYYGASLESSPKMYQSAGSNNADKTLPKKIPVGKFYDLVYGSKIAKSYSLRTQTWQGYVLEIKQGVFTAKLEDVTKPGGTYEIGEFELADVSPGDVALLRPCAIFYWSVGSSITDGQIKKESIIRFKRVAKWTEDEYESASDLADSWHHSIVWE
jgi:hypothetical protein